MAIAETAELVAELNLRGDFARQASRAQTALRGLARDGSRFRTELGKARRGLVSTGKTLAGVAAGGIAFLAYNVKQGIDSLAELEDVQNATAAAIKSTGGVAKVTAKAVGDLAGKYEDLTTIDDKLIQSGENVLLTFTKIKRDAFEPALAAALDLSVGMGQSLQSSIVQVGKALSDPIRGISALTRVGVTFSDEQKKVIKRLVETGQVARAQKIILRELNTEFGGRAKAAAAGYRGSVARVNDAIEGLQQSLAEALLPALTRVSQKITGFLKAPRVRAQVQSIGRTLASLFTDSFTTEQVTEGGQTATVVKTIASPFTQGLGLIKTAFGEIRNLPWDVIRGALQTTLDVGRKALEIFQGLPPELQSGLIALLAANKITGGALAGLGKMALELALKAVTTIVAGNVTVVGKTITPGAPGTTPGGGPPVPVLGGAGIGIGQDVIIDRGLAIAKGLTLLATFQAAANHDQQRAADILAGIRGVLSGSPGVPLAPVSNDILDAIAGGTTTISEDGKETKRGVIQVGSATMSVVRQLLRAIPIIGSVRDGVSDVANVVRNKDLRVQLSVTNNISAVTYEGAATTVRATNRFIAS